MTQTNSSGFTIVELIIAITISAVLSTAILGFMADELEQNTKAATQGNLLNQAKLGLDRISTDIRLSSNADDQNRWPDNYPPTQGNAYSWQSNQSTLILATAAQDIHGNILWQDSSKYLPYDNNIIYFTQNGTLYKRILAAQVTGNAASNTCPSAHVSASCPADEIILQNVTGFSISYRDGYDNDVTSTPSSARSIVMQITITTSSYGQTLSESYTERMVFRND